MANCYAIANPVNGQKCNDDVLGAVQYNAGDGTWEKVSGYFHNDGIGDYFNLDNLLNQQWTDYEIGQSTSGTPGTGGASDFMKRYGFYVVAAGAFLLLWFLWPKLTGKKK